MQNDKLPSKQPLHQKAKSKIGVFVALLLLSAIALLLFYPRTSTVKHISLQQESNYAIHKRQEFNQSQSYPPSQTPDPKLYQPVGKWMGRLLLPNQQQIQPGVDWVWMEVQHAPPEGENLVGKIVRLEWQNTPEVQSYVQAVQQDISFTDGTRASQAQGIIHPSRLDGRSQVGPLQSLAGARPNDDVIVTLDDAALVGGNQPYLQIAHEPVIVTGRFYGLVKILNPVPPVCPENTSCVSDFFRVRHYNPASGDFDGVEETIRIPQQVVDTRNIPPSTTKDIEKSPAGQAGWYIYGAKDTQGIFVVQGIKPRSLLQLQPQHLILGTEAGLNYIRSQNWRIRPQDKGTVRTVLLDPTTSQVQVAVSNWQEGDELGLNEGDRAILLHNFGGIGGQKSEGSTAYTITGHFAFGLAQVIRDPITKELQFAIEYQQIYANNSDGIIAGRHSWADYMGNLQWGWAATRPTSDVLIKFAPVTEDYDFGGIKLSPLTELQRQLQVMMARYRTGDGTGSATVTPATSCVQDASQALYSAIQVITQQVATTPAIQQWLTNHGNDPQTLRFRELVRLSSSLQQRLTPLGIVRADWQSNADYLMGTGNGQEPFRDGSNWAALTTWRTMVPRQAHDELAALFLRHGGKLWFLRTNQIGGENPEIAPVAPTFGLGEITIPSTNIAPIPIIVNRLLGSLVLPRAKDWLIVGITVLIYTAIAIPLGWRSGFLFWSFTSAKPFQQLGIIFRTIISPAIAEELFFRVLLLPHPIEVINWYRWTLWAGFILLLFILYHPLNAKTLYRVGSPTFFHPMFLTLTGLLGLCCTIAYAMTGSLWAIVFIHWIVVLVWLLGLGGRKKLSISH